ncbi:MAG TPA: transketolase C-terminal domain-containing protein [Gryllotalpicola sp.]
MTAQRQVWGETVSRLAADDPTLLVLDGDLATSTKADIIAAEHPEQFIEIGIAEQNMVGMAVGLSTLGYRPWLSTFGVFLTQRALDQVRMLVSQTKSPVRLAGSYTGLLNGSSGKTHQDIEDLAIMRAMPNMTVIAPADAREAQAATEWAAQHDGPVYLRLARDSVDEVFTEGYRFEPGVPRRVRDGADAVVVSTGVQTSRTRAALDELAGDGIDLALVHLATLKPLDEAALLAEIGDAKTVITVEEHSVLGGLGGLVSEIVAGSPSTATVHRIGLADHWSESAPNDFLLDKYGLSSRRVAEQLRAVLGR